MKVRQLLPLVMAAFCVAAKPAKEAHPVKPDEAIAALAKHSDHLIDKSRTHCELNGTTTLKGGTVSKAVRARDFFARYVVWSQATKTARAEGF